MNTQHSDIVVLGAGISGLTSAFFADKAGLSVQILEDSGRPGGVIRSLWKDGFLLEFGPNTIQPTADLMDLIDALNLSGELLLAEEKAPRYIQWHGTLHPVPMSPFGLLKTQLFSPLGKARLFLEPFIPANKTFNDESVDSFFRRRIGNEATERVVHPFVSGIWAGSAEQLSARSSFNVLYEWEKKHGGLLKGMFRSKKTKKAAPAVPKGLLNFTNGVETLSTALANHLKDIAIYGEQIEEVIPPLSQRQFPRWKIRTSERELTCDDLIFTLPAFSAAKLIKPFAAGTAWTLSDIPYVPLAVFHLALPKKNVAMDLNGFGFLVAPSEKSDILGCIWSSSLFPNRAPQGMVLLTVLLGGARQAEKVFLGDRLLTSKVIASLQPVLKFRELPEVVSIFRYETAIPQYTLGHPNRMKVFQNAQKNFPGLHLSGNFTEGVGVGNVVQTARKLVADIVADRKSQGRVSHSPLHIPSMEEVGEGK